MVQLEPVPGLVGAERRRRNLAIVLVVVGLVGMGALALMLLLFQAKAKGRGDYGGAESLPAQTAPPPGPSAGPR